MDHELSHFQKTKDKDYNQKDKALGGGCCYHGV